MSASGLHLHLYPTEFSVFKLPPNTSPPLEIFQVSWYTMSRTPEELSIILPSIPSTLKILQVLRAEPGVEEEAGWRLMKIDGILDFGLVGVLASIVNPLKEASVPVFVVSTYNTDYVLVKYHDLDKAKQALKDAGHSLHSDNVTLPD